MLNVNTDTIFGKDNEVKIVLVGDSKVGKTEIINRAVFGNASNSYYKAETGFPAVRKLFKIHEKPVMSKLQDTKGIESNTYDLYKNANIVLFIYAISNERSFEDIKNYWLTEVNKKVENSNYMKVLIGNKSDSENERKVKQVEAENFAKSKDFDLFYEISAKNNKTTIEEAKEEKKGLELLFTKIIEKYFEISNKKGEEEKNSFEVLEEKKEVEKNSFDVLEEKKEEKKGAFIQCSNGKI